MKDEKCFLDASQNIMLTPNKDMMIYVNKFFQQFQQTKPFFRKFIDGDFNTFICK